MCLETIPHSTIINSWANYDQKRMQKNIYNQPIILNGLKEKTIYIYDDHAMTKKQG